MQMLKIDIRQKRQATLPQELLDKLDLDIGDSLAGYVDLGKIVLVPQKRVALDAFSELQKIIKAHINGQLELVISQAVLTEIVTNSKNKIPAAMPAFEKFFRAAPPEVVLDSKIIDPKIASAVDQKDQKTLASAVGANCQYFITGNIKNFDLAALEEIFELKITTPAETVKLLKL